MPAQHPMSHAHPQMFVLAGPAAVLSQPTQRRPVSVFISDDLKKELQRRSELMLKGTSPDGSCPPMILFPFVLTGVQTRKLPLSLAWCTDITVYIRWKTCTKKISRRSLACER